jgi:hypothetical protein
MGCVLFRMASSLVRLCSEYDFYLIVGLCLLGVFIATTAFSFSPWTGLILCVVIFMIVTEVLGLLP